MSDDPAEMAVQAVRCRRLAKWSNGSTRNSLIMLAEDYERREQAARDDGEATSHPLEPT